MNSGCFRSELHPTTVLDAPSYNCKTTNYAIVQRHLLAKRNSWLKIGEFPSVLGSDTLSPYVQVVCNGSNECVFSARLQ